VRLQCDYYKNRTEAGAGSVDFSSDSEVTGGTLHHVIDSL